MSKSPTGIVDELAIALTNMGNAATSTFTPTLRLGVTGLSRSGKTIFITSLVKNLLDGEKLNQFSPLSQGRFIGAQLSEHPNKAIPRFTYEEHLAALTAKNPFWPTSTSNISQLRLTLKFRSNNWLSGMGGPSTLNLDIVDYPGEWLLDLPLLSLNYAQWSAQALERCKTTKTTVPTKAFLAALQPLNKEQEASEPLAQNLASLFTDHLHNARTNQNALSTLPPGRFLLPGDMKNSPALTFAPLPKNLENHKNDSLYALMNRRYEAYKSIIVRPFFRDHFASLDRQIVLVDALRALNAGPNAVNDLQEALNSVLACFRQGSNNPLNWVFAKKIDRILFAATKADHVHHTSHKRLQNIIEILVARAAKSARFSGAETKTMAIAAIRATKEGTIKDKDGELDCLIGTPEKNEVLDKITYDGKTEIALFPGDLPKDPQAIFQPSLKPGSLNFMRFAPPKELSSSAQKNTGLPHIRLDKALDYLLGDWMK
ncbi:Amino acid regulated cytosolic protein [hydrothermal vent metagenome]|uniref:Amino acid regulated cytosolic protein n=1 Tax=hydrothermal vent metagenome TaxID=652676 RepID=A0A3B0TWL0_9ZZZZ